MEPAWRYFIRGLADGPHLLSLLKAECQVVEMLVLTSSALPSLLRERPALVSGVGAGRGLASS